MSPYTGVCPKVLPHLSLHHLSPPDYALQEPARPGLARPNLVLLGLQASSRVLTPILAGYTLFGQLERKYSLH